MVMLMPIVIVGIVAGAAALAILVLRSNGAVVFLSLCAGSLLVTKLGYDATNAARMLTRNEVITNNGVQLAVLLVPAVLAALFTRKVMSSSRFVLNIVPAVATGALAALLSVPLLPGHLQESITTAEQWNTLLRYQSAVLIVGIVACLIALWLMAPKHRNDHDKKHKKH